MSSSDLSHFIEAQDAVWPQVTAELAAGRKRTHWMWFVFPQIAGLGFSHRAQVYAIKDLDHARRYLADDVLGTRLREGVQLMLRHAGRSATDILGAPDDMKLRSCLTLFREAASGADSALFDAALGAFYGGQPDPRTLELLH
ncbi:DUF1810 domain-containing protein [Emcibacter sp. SYSU 3D8]|uniref:DUF1810 domain-containing protein n=1 Tax=Emcibacter sp. SYSU 3D8 TaxID=3133969 RepID=UPI0031FE6BD6